MIALFLIFFKVHSNDTWSSLTYSHLHFETFYQLKEATKSYFTHYSCVVIVLFNTVLCRSAFSTVSLRNLGFRLSVISLNQVSKICVIKYVILICSFVLTLPKNSPFINNKLYNNYQAIYKSFTVLFKNMLSEMFWVCIFLNSFIMKSVE